jgi:hypothetical protein
LYRLPRDPKVNLQGEVRVLPLLHTTPANRYVKNGNVGPSYPQALSVVDPAPKDLQGLYVASTNNKEDVVITKMSWTAVLGSPSN